MMKKIIHSVLIVAIIISLITLGQAEEADESSITEDKEKNIEFTLDKALSVALERNLQWKMANKELELQDLQNEIVDDLNNDLRSAEKSLRNSQEMLSESILLMQKEIAFVNSLEGKVGDNWSDLNDSSISKTYIKKLTSQFGSEFAVREMSIKDFAGVLQTATEGSSEAYFQIRTGKNQTIKEANSSAASLMGLKAIRKLTMKQSLKLINMAVDHGAALIKKADKDAGRGLEILAEKAFYEVLKAQKLLNVQTKAVNRAKEQYETAQKSFEQGLLSNGELEIAQLQLNNMKVNLYGAEIELNKANMDFCVALGLPLEQAFTLIEPKWSLIELDLAEGLEYAKTNRTDMVTAAQGLELAELNLEYIAEKYKDTSDEYKESLLYKEKKQLEYEKTWVDAETEIRKSHCDWRNAEYALEQIASNLALVENQMNIAKISFDIGYSSGGSPLIVLLQAQEQVATLEQALTTAEFGRNLAWQRYLKEVGNYDAPVEGKVTAE